MINIEQAREQENSYQPNAKTMELLSRVTIVPFVGATATGKNFLMNASGYHVVGTTLTRQPRSDDNPEKYTYVANDFLLQQISDAEVVQYAVSPTSPTIYSSMASDYAPDQPNAMDCFFDAVDGLMTKGYNAVKTISVLTPADQWQTQLEVRYLHDSPKYIRTRLDEAERSIAWSLAQHAAENPAHHLVINDPAKTEGNIRSIHQFVTGEEHAKTTQEEAQAVAADMYELIRRYRARLGIQ